jgi:hypothetical protein
VCDHCNAETEVVDYGKSIFFVYTTRKNHKFGKPESGILLDEMLDNETERQQSHRLNNDTHMTRSDSEVQMYVVSIEMLIVSRVLKLLASFLKTQRSSLEAQATKYLEILELMKKEFKCIRLLWQAQKQFVSAHDELDMCVSRIRLRSPG